MVKPISDVELLITRANRMLRQAGYAAHAEGAAVAA
jgi:hypothetical protein